MKLTSIKKKMYNGDYEATILEQWKTCVEMANYNTDKRNTANNVYITINSALLAVVTFSLDYKSIVLSCVGLFICILWSKTINSYVKLSKAKYDIINEIEKILPLKPFTYEWAILKKDKYTGLTKIEKILPIVFIILFSIAILYPLGDYLFPYIKELICCSNA